MDQSDEKSVDRRLDFEELDYEDDVQNTRKSSPVDDEDVEDGEIQDEEDYLGQNICPFFKTGQCASGRNCQFLHMSDKGLYRMLESPILSHPPKSGHASIPIHELNCTCYCAAEKKESDWDKDLREAKERVQQWDCMAKRENKNLLVTLESDNLQVPYVSTQQCKSPITKGLPCSCCLLQNLKSKSLKRDTQILLKQSLKNETSSDSSSSKSPVCFFRKQRHHSHSKHNHRIHSKPQYSRQKTIIHRSSSASPKCKKKCKKLPLYNSREEHLHSYKNLHPLPQEKIFDIPKLKDVRYSDSNKKRTPLNFSSDLSYLKKNTEEKDIAGRLCNILDVKLSESIHWTPKKVFPTCQKFFSPSVRSCSDMSISPLTDSSLSELFDPNRNGCLENGQSQNDISKSCMSTPKKICQSEVSGPVCSQGTHSVLRNRLEKSNPKCEIKNSSQGNEIKKNNILSNAKRMAKQNIDTLENDLLKFHKKSQANKPVCSTFRPKLTKKNDKTLPQKMSLLEAKKLSKKEILLKQLEEVNAAIDRKRKMNLLK